MKWILFLIIFSSFTAYSQTDTLTKTPPTSTPKQTKKWFETINIRGYMQTRYNRLLETNPELKCEQCDKSWGEDGGLFIRRMRLVFYGQVHERVYVYFQPDFASSASSTGLNFGQLRDAYVDIGLDKKNEYRVRLGQSKIPFGFENLQSSQNRLPLDRNDALNSALANERDIAAILYWAPQKIRKRFSSLVNEGYKGEGDYGVIGFGVFNGQTANKPDQNNNLHIVGRIAYPMEIGNQNLEPAIQAYTGKYVVTPDQISPGTKVSRDRNYIDQRIAATLVLYPKPFGIQTEYNIGKGPEFNKTTDSIETKTLKGGYVTFNYKLELKDHILFPFIRLQQYTGGKKHELDARSYDVKELEIGTEWQPIKNFELVVMYTISKRRFEDFKNKENLQSGSLLRIQAQVNF